MAAKYMTAKEVAKLLSVNISTLYRWRKNGEGPPWVKRDVGLKQILYPEDECWRWIDASYAIK